ncbi:MAG: hypothetical protein IJ025_04410 [Clostridia bacterium]|nr:hypothetical protein [Clostridia bacterium]
MTLQRAIELFDCERANAIALAEKIRWISQLDYKISSEICEPRGAEPFKGYSETSPLTTEIKAPDEYGEIYGLYLNMKLDYMNGEIARFNNSALLFNNMYKDMSNYLNRKQAILKNTGIKAGDLYV